MKRWREIAAIAVLGILLPRGQGVDIAKLEPVEAIYIYIEEGKIRMQTDTGSEGTGYTLAEALEDLHKTASAVVFPDTADYLLVTEQTKSLLPELAGLLRPSAKVLLAAGPVDMERILPFIKNQDPRHTLKDVMMQDTAIPKLMYALGRYYLE